MKSSSLKALPAVLCLALFLIGSGGNLLELRAQSREKNPEGGENQVAVAKVVKWDLRETAVIVCDMWDRHWCSSATGRVAELAPSINEFIKAAREKGMIIIHAPSDTMKFYRGHQARLNALSAPLAKNLPLGMLLGRAWLDDREKAAGLPIDDTDGGCDVALAKSETGKAVWTRQISTIEIRDEDYITASGATIWNVLEHRGIKNVLMVGVHTNMCILGRPFGLRNLVHHGKNAMLVRDLTDAMYNPEMPPGVDHFTGTGLVIEHIEKYVCPTILSTEITGQPAFRFQADVRSGAE